MAADQGDTPPARRPAGGRAKRVAEVAPASRATKVARTAKAATAAKSVKATRAAKAPVAKAAASRRSAATAPVATKASTASKAMAARRVTGPVREPRPAVATPKTTATRTAPAKRTSSVEATPTKRTATKRTPAVTAAPARKAATKRTAAVMPAPAKKAPTKRAAPARKAATKRAAAARAVAPTAAETPSYPSVADRDAAVPTGDQSAPDTTRPTTGESALPPPPPPTTAPPAPAPANAKTSSATGTLVLAIVSLVLCFVIPLPIVALILALRARSAGRRLATAATLIALLALVGGVAADVGVALARRSPGGVSYTELRIGDCVKDPKDTFIKAKRVNCAQEHGLEVFALVDDPAAKGAPFPDKNILEREANIACLPQFQSYVGIPFDQSSLLFQPYVPTKQNWQSGNRRILCTIAPKTGTLKGSVKGSSR